MSTKKNKILQNAPVGYYVVDYNPDVGLIKTPITSFVFYFENTQNDYETISTNYLTINDNGFNTCSRLASNYNYVMHPDGLIYPVNNTLDWQPMTEDKFISKKKLNYIKNVDNEFSQQYKDYIDCFTIDKPSDYSNYFKKYPLSQDVCNTTNDIANNYDYQNNYKSNTYEYVNRKWGEFNDDKTENDILKMPDYNTFNYTEETPSHINFSNYNDILKFNNKEEAGKYCLVNKYSTINNNININGKLFNSSYYGTYVFFFQSFNNCNDDTITFKYPELY